MRRDYVLVAVGMVVPLSILIGLPVLSPRSAPPLSKESLEAATAMFAAGDKG